MCAYIYFCMMLVATISAVCAPTRPLVTQQIQACYKIMGIPERDTAEISGRSKPESRVAIWDNKRVFFCTPHTLVKDIEERRCDAESIVCVVMDEAHRATGNHANAVLVKLIEDSGAKFRLVGLSATPGTGIKEIQSVINTLRISQIEARTEDDPIVKQYIHHREEEVITVKQPDAVKALDRKFSELVNPIMERLREERVASRLFYDSANLKPYAVLQAKNEYNERTGDHRLDPYFLALRELTNTRQLLKDHGVLLAKTKLAEMISNGRTGYLGKLVKGPVFQSLWNEVLKASNSNHEAEGSQIGEEDLTFNNPKYSKLAEVLVEHFERKQAINESTRVIVFSQWRDSVGGIVSMLSSQNSSLLKPTQFIGQSKKSYSKGKKSKSSDPTVGQDQAGMNQAQQQKVLEQFSNGIYNVLVCTCVGEEGLDIGEVDLIVNFDVLKSPIRSIQRSGRTGRARVGRVIFLVSEGQEQRSHNESKTNMKKISRALRDPKVFKFCRNIPMFPAEPGLLRQKMMVKNFRMSQVGGHTPKMRKRIANTNKFQGEDKVTDCSWKLSNEQENERRKLFGYLSRSSCQKFESTSCEFPSSLRKSYLKSRKQAVCTRGNSKLASVLNNFERRFLVDDKHRFLREKKESCLSVSGVVVEPKNNKENSTSNAGTPCPDSDGDCAAMDICSDRSFAGSHNGVCQEEDSDSVQLVNYMEASGECSNILDEVFGPIEDAHNEIVHMEQIADIFDSKIHMNSAVVAPHHFGMIVPSGNDSQSSSQSTEFGEDDFSAASVSSKLSQLSVNTMNDDLLCAFFEKNEPTELDQLSNTNISNSAEELKSPTDDFSIGAEDNIGFEMSEKDICAKQDDEEGIIQQLPSNDPPQSKLPCNTGDISTLRNSSTAKARGADDDTSTEAAHIPMPKDIIGVGAETSIESSKKRITNSSLPLQHDVSGELVAELSSKDPQREAAGIKLPDPQLPPKHSVNNTQATVSQNCLPNLDVMAEFESSSPLEDTNTATAHADPVLEAGTKLLNRVAAQQPAHEDAYDEVVAFQLPTPPDSTDEDSEDDCSIASDAPRNVLTEISHSTAHCVRKNDSELIYGTIELSLNDANEDEEKFGLVVDYTESKEVVDTEAVVAPLQLPTQYSSSSEDEDESVESNAHGIGEACASENDSNLQQTPIESTNIIGDIIDLSQSFAKSPSPQFCTRKGGRTILSSTVKGKDTETSQASSDQCIVDTPNDRQVRLKTIAPHNTPDDLTDTPIKDYCAHENNSPSDQCLVDTPESRHIQFKRNTSRMSPDDLTDTPTKSPLQMAAQRKRLRPAIDGNKENKKTSNTDKLERKNRLKKIISEKYKCRFLDTEAANDDSDNDSDEDDAVRQIEREEMSQDSFINDGSQLGFTQDDLDRINADAEVIDVCEEADALHRQLDHQRNLDNQFTTPILNRRMRRSLDQSQTQSGPSSQKGLGRMHFIRSVLEHHRQGGDADEIEDEYCRLVGHESPEASHSLMMEDRPINNTMPVDPASQTIPSGQAIAAPGLDINTGLMMPPPARQQQNSFPSAMRNPSQNVKPKLSVSESSAKPPALTAEQRAMIEAKRLEALKRRQQRMLQQAQHQQVPVRANPYANKK